MPSNHAPDTLACVGLDPEAFYPDAGNILAIQAAKAICAACPALQRCGEDALDRGENWGVWGGLSEDDRRRMLRARTRAAERARARGSP